MKRMTSEVIINNETEYKQVYLNELKLFVMKVLNYVS